MINSLYSDLPPPKFGDNEENSNVFIDDVIKPLLKPTQVLNPQNVAKSHISAHISANIQYATSKQLDSTFTKSQEIASEHKKSSDTEQTDDEDYNPAFPNNYDLYMNMNKPKRNILPTSSKITVDLNISGEEAWKRRAQMSESATSPDLAAESVNIGKKNLATKLMEKMGWKEGEGLGKNKQGMKKPLIVKKINKTSAVITTQEPFYTPNKKE